jgi:MerR family copper efflux transcriptional regulator
MNIGKAAQQTGLSAKMIRHYERMGLLPPAGRSQNGYRQFAAKDLQRLRFIRRARRLGFSLEAVGRLLALEDDPQRASADVRALAVEHIETLNHRIAELRALRTTLRALVERCHADETPHCPILDELQAPEGDCGQPSNKH